MLPKVRALITGLQGNGDTKPNRITIGAVERLLPLSSKSLDQMPACKALVNQHITTQEEHWARLLEWAIRQMADEGRTINWKSISTHTNMRKRYIKACVPYLHEDAAHIIRTLFPELFVDNN